MEVLPPAFEELATYNQFIVYKLQPRKNHIGKMDKIPINHYTLKPVNAHDSTNWLDAATALVISSLYGAEYGVGFVFTKNDPFFFIDIDDCLDSSGDMSPLAKDVCATFPGAAIETSNSRRGLHIIGKGTVPTHRCKNIALNIEFYTENRFVALTGINAQGSAKEDYSAILPIFINKYFPPSTRDNAPTITEWTTEACRGYTNTLTDEQLLKRALDSKSGHHIFGNKASFKDLWEANTEKLAVTYPSSTHTHSYDESAADAALAQHLAFWTGKNCERIQQLMLQSKLNREKWDRTDYLPRTILSACAKQKEFLGKTIEFSKQIIPQEKLSTSTLKWFDVSIHDIFSNPPKPLLFLIDDLFPASLLTFFTGHGGSGKSMLALQAAVCLATGLPFMGKIVQKSQAIFFSGEDSAQIIQIRLAKICLSMGVSPVLLAENLKIIDATTNPNLYMESANRQTITSPGYDELLTQIKNFEANVVIIDNASDTFDANENIRAHVRGFIRALVQLDVAILLLAHVDKQTAKGENSNESYSGSTQWHNSARSRWHLKSDGALLTLQHKKSNHGKLSSDISLTWSPNGTLANFTSMDQKDTLDIILSLIDKHTKRGNLISTAPTSPMNPFKVLKADPAFPSSIRSCADLMRLLCLAEDTGKLIRTILPGKKRGTTREIFTLTPTAPTCPNIVSAVDTEPYP